MITSIGVRKKQEKAPLWSSGHFCFSNAVEREKTVQWKPIFNLENKVKQCFFFWFKALNVMNNI